MIVKWNDVQDLVNDLSMEKGIPCEQCGHLNPHEHVEFIGLTFINGQPSERRLEVKRVTSHGRSVKIVLDC